MNKSKILSIPILLIIVIGVVYLVDDVQGSELSLQNNDSQKISSDLDLPNTESTINVLEIGIDIDPTSTVVILPYFTVFTYEKKWVL